jgi:hypothetical protein
MIPLTYLDHFEFFFPLIFPSLAQLSPSSLRSFFHTLETLEWGAEALIFEVLANCELKATLGGKKYLSDIRVRLEA